MLTDPRQSCPPSTMVAPRMKILASWCRRWASTWRQKILWIEDSFLGISIIDYENQIYPSSSIDTLLF